jgi:hypothetical protein
VATWAVEVSPASGWPLCAHAIPLSRHKERTINTKPLTRSIFSDASLVRYMRSFRSFHSTTGSVSGTELGMFVSQLWRNFSPRLRHGCRIFLIKREDPEQQLEARHRSTYQLLVGQDCVQCNRFHKVETAAVVESFSPVRGRKIAEPPPPGNPHLLGFCRVHASMSGKVSRRRYRDRGANRSRGSSGCLLKRSGRSGPRTSSAPTRSLWPICV